MKEECNAMYSCILGCRKYIDLPMLVCWKQFDALSGAFGSSSFILEAKPYQVNSSLETDNLPYSDDAY